MKLINRPFEPSLFSEVINPSISEIWNEFKKSYS